MKFGGYYTFTTEKTFNEKYLTLSTKDFLVESMKLSNIYKDVLKYEITEICYEEMEVESCANVHFEITTSETFEFKENSKEHLRLEEYFACGLTIYYEHDYN